MTEFRVDIYGKIKIMPKTFNFSAEKGKGDSGQRDFYKKYKKLGITKLDGLIWDFDWNGDGVELKTDFHKSKNFFMERYSNISSKKAGGPWRSLDEKCKYFVYYFINEKTYFWFETARLVELLDKNIKNYTPKIIHNRNYESLGYLVPKIELLDLNLEIK